MISMNDRVCEGFAQRDLNPALALRNTAALPEQEHEPITKGEIAATSLGKERSSSMQGPPWLWAIVIRKRSLKAHHNSESITFPNSLFTLYSVDL